MFGKTVTKALGVASMGLLLVFSISGCDDWVQDVDDPINLISEDNLQQAELVEFVLKGTQGAFAETHDDLTVNADGLSDQQVFDRDLPQATFPSFDRLERGDFSSDDETINNEIGEMRFMADNLLEVVDNLEDTGDFQEQVQEARFWGHFLGGLARDWYATYVGLEPENGGGVIDNGPFVPSSEMYTLALDKLEASLQFATPYQERVVHSVMARIHLYDGNFQAAMQEAQMGLEPGDPPFESLHSVQSTNTWYFAAGEGRVQWRADERFPGYVEENPEEEARLPMWNLEGREGTLWSIQDKWDERGSSITVIDWQETYLIMAELGLRGDASVDPLELVNEVRASHGISPLSSVDMDALIVERDKELFVRGQRLVDQRRFDMWHLPAGTWKFLPISQDERNNNPNLS